MKMKCETGRGRMLIWITGFGIRPKFLNGVHIKFEPKKTDYIECGTGWVLSRIKGSDTESSRMVLI